MKVLLVAPKLTNNEMTLPLHLGLLSIASYLTERNHDVRIFDNSVSKTRLKKVINDFRPDIAGVSVVASKSLKDAIFLSKILKKNKLFVVWGGAFVSSIPEKVIEEPYVDCVILGEGEKTWSELLEKFKEERSFNDVAGLCFKQSNKIIRTRERELLSGSDLPQIKYDFLYPPDYFFPFYNCERVSWVCDGKGCFGKCTFCYNQDYNKGKCRKRPMENVLSEVKTLVANYGADGIYFTDELWCRSSEEMREYCDALSKLSLEFVWGCFMRVGILSKEDYDYMYKAGCRWICFGIESGSKDRHIKIKKGIRFEKIIPSIKDCSASGIVPWMSFIIGFPNETTDELLQTVDLMKVLKDYGRVNANFYKPYAGSEMYNDLIKEGKIKPISNLKNAKDTFSSEWIVLSENYSKIPTLHLKVIMAFSMWWSLGVRPFSQKGDDKKKTFSLIGIIALTIKAVKNILTTNGIVYFIQTTIRMLRAGFYLAFFPGIRKKYNLKF